MTSHRRGRRKVVAALALALAPSACAPRFLVVDQHYAREEAVVAPPTAPDPPLAPTEGPCTRPELDSLLLYAPDPDYVALARAWPRRADTLEVTIAYCINTAARTYDVELERSSGVDAIDKAALEAVATWRAKPHYTDREPVHACTAMTFSIRAIRPRRQE